jgi:hypothetical protein
VHSPEAIDAGKLGKNTQCNGDIIKHTRGFKFQYFLKQLLRLAIELKVHGICPFEGGCLIAKIFF